MNEVTKIHLSRQPFTISVDAHHDIKQYLDAIAKQVDDKDVMAEIESRMAELLVERGIDANKVILPEDVNYLKQQLGTPTEFKEDKESKDESTEQLGTKKLFRDPTHGMIAGVASGLSQYLGLDVSLIRILFVILVIITFGWGILFYILLWLLVPEVKTPSDRLQMSGKRITVESIKELVGNSEFRDTAHRVQTTLVDSINSIFNIFLKIVGLALAMVGLTAVFGLIAGEVYYLSNTKAWLKNNIFPVGSHEQLLLHIAVSVIGLIAILTILSGMAIFRRRWPTRAWVTGILIGLVLVGFAIGGALASSVYPNIRDRYNANTHTTVRSVPAFTSVSEAGNGVDSVNFQSSSKSYIVLNYYGHPKLSNVKTYVVNGVLWIDSTNFNWHRDCSTICIPNNYNMSITLYSPNNLLVQNQNINFTNEPSAPIKPALP